MSVPEFSVVIPAYNAETTIRSTVASVLEQSDQDFEIVLVDDRSTDETLKALLGLAAMDSRIRVVSKPNSGVSATRNFGANLAKGRWLAFLDADDQWHREKLARHRSFHDFEPLLTASFAKVAFAPNREGELAPGRTYSRIPADYLDTSDVLVENVICTTSNLVIDREFFLDLGGFDESMRYAEDQDLIARVLGEGALIRGIDEPLVRYRMSEYGLSSDFSAMLTNWRRFAARWMDGQELPRAEATYCRYLTRRALRTGAPMDVVWSFARRGLEADKGTFMAGGSRSLLTVGGAFVGGAMPPAMRRALFA